MAGIYIHIPYCKQACSYCNFHFSTQRNTKENLLKALTRELELRKDFFNERDLEIASIYFGGGTPSLLSIDELQLLLDAISKYYKVSEEAEVSIETNPDDLTADYLNALKGIGFNRLSIGVQSFHPSDLVAMNRAHNKEQALNAIELAKEAGFENISVDLMYNLPGQSLAMWKDNLEQLITLKVPHISCYSLTVEEKTLLHHQLKMNKVSLPNEGDNVEQYRLLVNVLKEANYIHYEISNFSLQGFESRHNSAYWKNKSYIGIGPSAHSYNGKERSWNVANNSLYVKEIAKGNYQPEVEHLTRIQRINDLLLTGLRTVWGVDVKEFEKEFGKDAYDSLLSTSATYLNTGHLQLVNNVLNLTEEGRLLADKITSELFFINES